MDIQNLTFDERDEFDRKTVANNIITLLKSDVDVSPLVIDGNWGTGKTEFCYKLKNLLSNEPKYKTIYIDAFKEDHINDPFLTILSEVIKSQPKDKQNKLIEKVIPIVKTGLKTAGKIAFHCAIPSNISDDLRDGLSELTDTMVNSGVEAMFENYLKEQENLEHLQSAIKNISKDNPLIIFIDELDRCKPDYSVRMLEVIKHIFTLDNVKFVLVTNMEQLEASVNNCYGNAICAKNYLDKFIKFRVCLPTKVRNNLVSIEHFKNLVAKSNLLKATRLNEEHYVGTKVVYQCIAYNNLSLREVETLVRHFEIYRALRKECGHFYLPHFGAICLYSILPNYVIPILKDGLKINYIENLLGMDSNRKNQLSHPQNIGEAYVIVLGCGFDNWYCQYLDIKEVRSGLSVFNDGYAIDKMDCYDYAEMFKETLSILSLTSHSN